MPESSVNRMQFVCQVEGDAKRFRRHRANITENEKCKLVLFRCRKALIGSLRGDGYELRAQPCYLRQRLLQCTQRQIAVWAPSPAVKTQYDGAFCQQIIQSHEAAACVGQ